MSAAKSDARMKAEPKSKVEPKAKAEPKLKRRGRMTQAERTALSDRRMFDAAVKLIVKHGANRATLKEIGETAGYSRGLANYRFGSKEDFIRHLVHEFNDMWTKELSHYVTGKTGPTAFFAAVDAVEHFLTNEPDYMRGMYILWFESVGVRNEVTKRLAIQHEAYRKDVQRWIRQGIETEEIDASVSPEQVAIQYCSFVFGTVYQWLVKPESLDLPAVFDYYRKQTLRAFCAPETAKGNRGNGELRARAAAGSRR
jgi:AcrR family transcriptional regulator